MADRMQVVAVDIRRTLGQSPTAKNSTVTMQGLVPEPPEGELPSMEPTPSLSYPVTAAVAFNIAPGDLYDMDLIKVNP